MLESSSKPPSLDSALPSGSTKRNPFELLASIFAKKKSNLHDVDEDRQKGSNDSGLTSLLSSLPSTTNSEAATAPTSGRRSPSKNRYDLVGDGLHEVSTKFMTISPTSSLKPILAKDDLEALHLSRQDNPYLQHLEKLSTHEDIPLKSELQSVPYKDIFFSDLEHDSEVDIHQHLIRSPPPQFPQNVTHFIYSRANSPKHQINDSSSSFQDPLNEMNTKKAKLLNPIHTKNDVDVLDPGIRKVLEYQKSQLATGFHHSLSSSQIEFGSGSLPYIPGTPSCLREIAYNPQSRWINATGSRPLQKGQSLPKATGSLVGLSSCYLELFKSEKQTARKTTPLGPIKVGRTCSGR